MSEHEQFPKDTPENCDSMCGQIRDLIVDYVEGDLSLQDKQNFEAHMEVCPDCSGFFASYQNVIDSAKTLRQPEKPIDVGTQNRLRSALNQRLGLNLTYIA